ncbi:carbon monoxide dehydrogenase subunit G [Neobacillus bataviensis LMG 21833]|uniref:Carbon monoxide dehydrogenase subunit G n=1 Tax=Neobacillus bataviensis LMG 21833 TaxID=1117379 RepID=K6CI51_9BACI|nr:carbon monoxide dehydrogenase subunit G [Neobacillus bataviensis]EKN70840.1 carbon monoxide dehydrogenase subunit G [Neobacillus bataviensis LMG 21833]
MKINYEYTFGLPRNIVWKYLMDKVVLRKAIPGCRTFVERSKGVYEAEVEISIGPLQDVFTLEIRIDHLKPPSSYRMYMKGKGNVGEINGTADMLLQELGSSTIVNCLAEAQVSGALALLGQRILESGAKKILDSFFQTVEKEIKGTIYQTRKSGR